MNQAFNINETAQNIAREIGARYRQRRHGLGSAAIELGNQAIHINLTSRGYAYATYTTTSPIAKYDHQLEKGLDTNLANLEARLRDWANNAQ